MSTKEQVNVVIAKNQESINNFLKQAEQRFGCRVIGNKETEHFELKLDEKGRLELVWHTVDNDAPCGWNFHFINERNPEWSFIHDHIWWGEMSLEALRRVKNEIERNRAMMARFDELTKKEYEEVEDFFA